MNGDATVKDPMPADAAPGPVYVGFWARFVAFLVDSTVAGLVIGPVVVYLIGEIDPAAYNLGEPDQLVELLQRLSTNLALNLLFMGTIFVLFWIFRNATPGKMIFRAVIVDARTLESPSVLQNVIRYLAYYLSLMPFGLGFLWIGFDSRKQGWHDKIAGTVVIRRHREKRRDGS